MPLLSDLSGIYLGASSGPAVAYPLPALLPEQHFGSNSGIRFCDSAPCVRGHSPTMINSNLALYPIDGAALGSLILVEIVEDPGPTAK